MTGFAFTSHQVAITVPGACITATLAVCGLLFGTALQKPVRAIIGFFGTKPGSDFPTSDNRPTVW